MLKVENAAVSRFRGGRRGFLEALTRSHSSLAAAGGVIRDELARRALAAKVAGSGETALQWEAEHEASAVATPVAIWQNASCGVRMLIACQLRLRISTIDLFSMSFIGF